MLQRHSSRRAPLDTFLVDALDGATAHDRIAGYFSYSVLEIAGEAIDRMAGSVRMVCNSDLDPADVATARAAALALRREWNAALPGAFDAHRAGEARCVLADQVGLGKTVQLGLAATRRHFSGFNPVYLAAPV